MVQITDKKASAGRVLIVPRGEWNSETTYNMLDLVNHNGYAWLAKRTVVGLEPSETYSEYWHNMLDIQKIVDNSIAESVADDVGNILEERFGNRLSGVEEDCNTLREEYDTSMEVLTPIPDRVKTLEDTTYTKTETLSDETREILELGAGTPPDAAFSALHSNFASLHSDYLNSLPIPLYLALTNGSTNSNMVNAALGMNNEDSIVRVGKALAMYARFIDSNININAKFSELMKCDSLTDINEAAMNEIRNNATLYGFAKGNNYMYNTLLNNSINTVIYRPGEQNLFTTGLKCGGNYQQFTTTMTNGGAGLVFSAPSGSGTYEVATSPFTSIDKFQTNGAKYLSFKTSLYGVSPKLSFGVIDVSTGTKRVAALDSNVSAPTKHYIDVSDFSEIQLFGNLTYYEGSSVIILNEVLLENFEV